MLPKISQPTFSVTQPSTGDILTMRPFLVKEEKLLLMAKESGEQLDIYTALKQIINNCVQNEGFDVDTIPIFDMEYIFIKLRSASVSNVVKFKVEDSHDGIEYDLELDLNDVEITYPEGHDNKIMITDEVGLVERQEFLDNLSIETYNKIQKFFETSPAIEHVVKYTNSEGTEKRVVFRELNDFFTLG